MSLLNYNKPIFGVVYPSHPLIYFISGFLQLAEGLATILSLGLYRPCWYANYLGWVIIYRCSVRESHKIKREDKFIRFLNDRSYNKDKLTKQMSKYQELTEFSNSHPEIEGFK